MERGWNGADYFEFYNLKESFHPDLSLVKQKFYQLSKKYHPDFHINESPEKQQEILEQSTLNNKAYQVLSDQRKLTEYILRKHNMLEEGDKYQLSPEFLMDMMEINEALMEVDADHDAESLKELKENTEQVRLGLEKQLQDLAASFDEQTNDGEDLLIAIRDLWYRLKYLARLESSFSKFL